MMANGKPRKPTQPFGHIAFGPTSKVTQHLVTLSGDKEEQERQAVEIFVSLFNEHYRPENIADLRQLPERDHDFEAKFCGAPVLVQLTELVDRSYTTILPVSAAVQAKLASRNPSARVTPTRLINRQREAMALWALIKRKLDKSYTSPSVGALWLVVFTTTVYATEYIQDGQRQVSEALNIARVNLALSGSSPFAQIWFTDLQLRPIRVWPPTDNAA